MFTFSIVMIYERYLTVSYTYICKSMQNGSFNKMKQNYNNIISNHLPASAIHGKDASEMHAFALIV